MSYKYLEDAGVHIPSCSQKGSIQLFTTLEGFFTKFSMILEFAVY
jgi:hypothetical protein